MEAGGSDVEWGRTSWCVLIRYFNWGSQKGLLIAGFGSWTLVVNLRKRKWPNKGVDLYRRDSESEWGW